MNRLPLCPRVRYTGPAGLPLVLVVAGLILTAGCAPFSSEPKRLPDSTFARVLTELHVVAARHDLDVPVPQGLRDSVFAQYGVTTADFDSTIRYYSRRPQDFKELYQPIIDTLQALQYRPSTDTTKGPPRPTPIP